ncbi:family 16 glycoside hydrolase [Rubripirellula amarantea]|nr:family 16 glycoside hydrolase [Rubripirellula amarantea]
MSFMRSNYLLYVSSVLAALFLADVLLLPTTGADEPAVEAATPEPIISVLIIDGENPWHDWKVTSPIIKKTLEQSGKFTVEVVTTPEDEEQRRTFSPAFTDYDLILSNYNGPSWSEETKAAFVDFVSGGGAFVAVHAADNAFPDWIAYNRMVGVGGWGGRNEKDGPYVRWQEDVQRIVRDRSPGPGGSHGKRHPFLVEVRDPDHSITRGLPTKFLQTEDELYAELRGPAENLHVLATAFSDPETGGTGQHEPILMTTRFGAGRIFHTTLGHDAKAMTGIAFQETLVRGAQWAATGQVTFDPISPEVLSAEHASERDQNAIGNSVSMPSLDGEDWVAIFNGTNLSGWTQKNGTATYRVEDAVIVGKTAKGSPNSFLCTEKNYADFELTFEVKVDGGLNSGVQIRSQSKPDFKNGRVHGPQIEIESAPGESGYVYSEGTGRNWITAERTVTDAFNNDQWNRYIVRASGPRIQTWVNGTAVADVVDDQSSRNGFVGLQVHSIGNDQGPFEVRWRDLRVRELASE